VIAGAAALAVVAVLGFYMYRSISLVNAPPPASSEPVVREAPADPGVIGRSAPPGDTKPAETGAVLTSPPVPPPAATAAAKPAAIVRPQAIKAGKIAEQREEPRSEACTEAIAALGLCAAKPVVKKEAAEARKAGGQEPPRTQTCTEAAAALGLCTPTIQHRRE